jgi:hypothetical protein
MSYQAAGTQPPTLLAPLIAPEGTVSQAPASVPAVLGPSSTT